MSELEVYSSIHDYTKYIVASEELEPGNGWEYASLINKTVNASDNPQKVASEWVESFKSFYSPYSIEATLSAFDTNRWDSLISAFSAWIAASGFTAANFKTDSGDNSITQQLGRDAQGANWTTVDFGMIVKNCRDTNTQKANDVTDILNQSIINKWSSQGISSSATGLSIGVPNNSNLLCKPENYKPCVYNEQWQWTSYLSQYLSKLNV
jgi:hypothetical protein